MFWNLNKKEEETLRELLNESEALGRKKIDVLNDLRLNFLAIGMTENDGEIKIIDDLIQEISNETKQKENNSQNITEDLKIFLEG